MLGISLIACQRNAVVERDITTPPVLQSAQQEGMEPSGASEGAPQQLPPGHPAIDGQTGGAASAAVKITVKPGEIKKVEGGVTIQECFAQKATLKGKNVRIRGKVVKYNAAIMGKNWIHIQDGTGGAGENDLIITTTQEAALDQVVVVSGTLQYDKNIGSGYVFPAIIENGSVKVE
ncbi:MAG: hypothetical protein A2X86_10110 [Bdellovibrionales bacterium GWA2_49_15]|nr:MAG: hypothetical protein A2X86_10110 [Bdellovibrionales bacterium GWA2_49_15]